MRLSVQNKTVSSRLMKPRTPCPRLRQQRRYNSSTPEPPQNQQNLKKNINQHSQSHNNAPPPSSFPAPPATPPPGSVASSAGGAAAPVPARSLREAIKAGPVGRLGRSYSRVQERRPYTTQLCSSVVVYLCGDLSAQLLFPSEAPRDKETEASREKDENGKVEEEGGDSLFGSGYDPWRAMRHLTVGVGSSIPSYNWFMFLHNNFNFTSKFLSILTKVCVQQAVFTPVFNTYFFSVHSLLSGASFEETFERLKKALPVSITNSVKLWPAVTAISFMYVPPQFRNVFSGCIAVGWQTYLSWLNQKAAREVEVAEMEELGASSAVVTGVDHSHSTSPAALRT